MKKILIPILIVATMACTESEKHPQPTVNTETTGWIYDEQISDEFDGTTLDSTKWHDHNPIWWGREPSFFSPGNVKVSDGMLILTGKRENLPNLPEGYHTFTTAAVQSTNKVLYGFFEIKCQAMNSALSSAFWLYVRDSIKQEEIDIFEICGRNDADPSYDHTYFATSHYMLLKDSLHLSDHVAHKSDVRFADKFIVAGLEWNRDEIIWYVDGEVIRRRKNDYWHSPETINFDSEAFPTWWGLPSDSDNGGEFKIEYFRYWTKPELYENRYKNRN